MHRTAHGNRIGLAIVGLVLLLAGLAALLRGLDVMPGVLGSAGAPILGEQVREVADQAWFWPVVAVALLVIALLAMRWLVVQTRTDAVRQLRLESDARRGATRMPADAATEALEEDLARSPYLQRARARMLGSPAHPRLQLAVTMALGAQPGDALARLHEALDRYGEAMDVSDPAATVLLRVAR